MKTCVSIYSFGPYLNQLGIYGVIDKVAEFGFEGIDFTLDGDWTENLDVELAKKVGEYAREKGLVIAASSCGANFLQGSNGVLQDEVDRLKRFIDFSAALGSPKMRHDVANGFKDRKYALGYDVALPRLAEGVRRLTIYAEQQGVKTMTENHGYYSQDSARVSKLIDTVNHPNFGALVDIGNFMCADEETNKAVGIMAPYAFHVHAKDFHFKSGMDVNPGDGWFVTRGGNYLRGAIIGHGDAKVFQSLRILKRAGYDGYCSIEFEGMEDKLKGIEVGLKNLKRFIAEA